jgi:hypothetical protein
MALLHLPIVNYLAREPLRGQFNKLPNKSNLIALSAIFPVFLALIWWRIWQNNDNCRGDIKDERRI